ncbi:MAG TPA: TetR/AcrR family transcriptional regulator [Spirochaetia bacterium]|nr:TetR/AcrR family transcriptional regulator [Spirochaetales bacterium]HRY78775.1 TetR/AcrR family transcriptional regulator [Spirochaetia bacterium]
MNPRAAPKRMGRPVRRPGEPSTRDRILGAAIRLFSENGYEGTSIKEITRAVNLTESAFYRHFKGKDELLAEIIAAVEGMVHQPLPGPEGQPAGGASVFRHLFEIPADAFGNNPVALHVCRFFFMECPRNERIRAYLKRAMEQLADLEVGRILEEEIEAGRILPCDVREVSRLVNVLRYQWCYQVAILDWDEGYDPEKSKRDLDPVIRFFEGLYSPGEQKTRQDVSRALSQREE